MNKITRTKKVNSRVNGCNFCTRKGEDFVWEVSSSDPNRNLVIAICNTCMEELKIDTTLQPRETE